MPFALHEVTDDADFDSIVRAEWAAYEDPFEPFLRIIGGPYDSSSPTARAEALEESKERQKMWAHEDPTSHWLKVVNTDTGEIIGAALWNILEDDSEPMPGLYEAYYWPEGTEGRNYASHVLSRLSTLQAARMKGPCVFLQICFVHPSHQRHGAGKLLVNWGVEKADAMGVHAFVEGTNCGCPLYEKYGFGVTDILRLDSSAYLSATNNDGGEVSVKEKEQKEQLLAELPIHTHFQYRPVGGKLEAGKTVLPWTGKVWDGKVTETLF
ncbi:MAG: hypothetical protein M1819_000343 [Sarea resinae]|nr:MAG: hypothetical protein M1819_000343 [Sarea resinae]